MAPVEGLDQKRTPSQGSLVGPRVTSTVSPAMSLGARSRRASAKRQGMGARRPCPLLPQASSPVSGPMMVTERDFRVAMLAWVAAFCHMRVFMAGAMPTGPAKARSCVLSMSWARPAAMRAMRFAEAGATSRAWQLCPGSRCAKVSSPVNISGYTGLAPREEKSRGLTKCCAPEVSVAETLILALSRWRKRSAAL